MVVPENAAESIVAVNRPDSTTDFLAGLDDRVLQPLVTGPGDTKPIRKQQMTMDLLQTINVQAERRTQVRRKSGR